MSITAVQKVRTKEEAVTLAAELERRAKTKRDFVVPGNRMGVEVDAALKLTFPGPFESVMGYPLARNGHNQLANRLDIPRAYYDRMLAEAPELLADNCKVWLGRDARKWMVRTLDDRVRALVSNSYRCLDDYDLFFRTFSIAREVGAEIQSASLSEDRFEMRFIVPSWREEIGYDDRTGPGTARRGFARGGGGSILIPGLYVANSEVGKSKMVVSPYIFDGICDNGLLWQESLEQVHVGRAQSIGEIVASEETRRLDDELLWSRVTDLVRGTFDREAFQRTVAVIRGATADELLEPTKAVDTVVARLSMTDEDRQKLLDELISPSNDRDPGRTVWGLVSSLTERAKAYDEDPERRSEIERFAGELLVKELVPVRR